MVIESRACPSCEDSVPPGRLSCPHCGAVLAAVAHHVAIGAMTESPAPAPAKRPARAKRPSRAAARKAVVTDDGWDLGSQDAVQPEPIEPALLDSVLSVPAPEVHSGWPPAGAAQMPPPPVPATDERPALAAERKAAVADDRLDADPDRAVQSAQFEPASTVPTSNVPAAKSRSPWPVAVATEPPPLPIAEPPPPTHASPQPPAADWPPAAEWPPAPAPGAYVPPVDAPASTPAPIVAEPVEPPPAPILPRAYDPVAAASGAGVAAAAPAAAGRVGRIAMPRIDRERVEETADVLMLVGSFGLVLSFLAPWADAVIGSRGRGYMDTWGLAGPGYVALFLMALGVLALAALQNPIGRWLRTGVAGVALGGFVLGLAWPYVVGPLGAGPGALLAWVSGFVLFVAGITSLLVLRHAALPPDV